MPPARLPLFPLPLVLFPGATVPLHVFEPRYRRMLADCLQGSREFGIVCRGEGGADDALPAGTVGCVARIARHETLPDGRSNIVVEGRERFAVARVVDTGQPYLVADVAAWDDEPEPESTLAPVARRVRALFARVARAARTIADDAVEPPPLPADPARLSFAIAALVDIALDARQQLLTSRSASARLRELAGMLGPAAPALEGRAEVHARARSNGHGPDAP
ncbi:MAG: LON peptidase substrate-binding domain-containing protein [Gemmatimonadetes bacterium]|nr:LON peptidase substrate-binding domain-containing protein [Gemmatimonadota bacterium]